MVIGNWFSGMVADFYMINKVRDWQAIWLVPVYIAAAVLIYFMVAFRDKKPV